MNLFQENLGHKSMKKDKERQNNSKMVKLPKQSYLKAITFTIATLHTGHENNSLVIKTGCLSHAGL